MTTSLNSSVPARDYASAQLVHYLRKAFDVTTTATTVVRTVGTIPANSIILSGLSGVLVTADFTGTTNLLDVGYSADSLGVADGNAYASALVLALTTGGFTVLDELGVATGRPRNVDTTITATWSGTASTGAFEVVIAYLPNR